MPEHLYRGKPSSDIPIATTSEGEEDKAVHDYNQRLGEVKDPGLKKAIRIARNDEIEHRGLFRNWLKRKRK